MSTCFIFFDAANYTPDADLPEQLWAVRLDDSGEVDIALSEHTPEAIQKMQAGVRTVVVLPTSVASIHLLNLPKLSMRKAREAIPYALEEALAEPVQEVQVACERDENNPLHYRVVALNKLRLSTWMSALDALGLAFDVMTLDWFALAPGEVCATDTDLLVCTDIAEDAINGALSPLVAADYMKEQSDFSGFIFDDSLSALRWPGFSEMSGSYRLFIASRLLNASLFNLCQGDFQRRRQGRGRTYWYALCGSLLGVWFFSVLGLNTFLLHQLHAKEGAVDGKIKTIYYGFFPDATQVISPRFRIERLLAANTADEASSFWLLLDKLSNVFLSHPLKIEHIQFRDQVISVSLIAENFAALEAFEQQLKNQQVVVKQIEASTRENQVVSTLELQL